MGGYYTYLCGVIIIIIVAYYVSPAVVETPGVFYLCSMEDKLLYPQFSVERLCYIDKDEVHALSRVLATWGYVIRSIESVEGRFEVRCYTGDSSGRKGQVVVHIPRENDFVGYNYKPLDLFLRYTVKDGILSDPVCVGSLPSVGLINLFTTQK